MNIMPVSSLTAVELRKQIRAGKYPHGQKLPDERALAKQFKVSRGTIRQALDILEQERLIIRQQGRGTFVSSPDFVNMVQNGTKLVGEMVFEREYYFETVIQGSAILAANRGYMITTGSNASKEEGDVTVKQFINNEIRGVIMTPRQEYSLEHWQQFVEHNIPVVFIDDLIPCVREDAVIVDNYEGTFMAVEHLVNLGHRKLAYVGHCKIRDIPCRPERRRGFIEACAEFGISIPDGWILEATDEDYHERISSLLNNPNRPTCVVCYNDTWATRVINIAREFGISVPNDLSVIGFDNSKLAEEYYIPLTSIAPKKKEMGMKSMEILIEKIENPTQRAKQKIAIIPDFVERKTTGRIVD